MMTTLIKTTFAPLLGLFIFLFGTGYFSTLLVLNMIPAHASTWLIGAMTGIYYSGLILGSLRTERVILHWGYRHAYSLFSLVIAACCLVHGLLYQPLLWLILRFIAGFATAGIYVVIESWLLSTSSILNRGRIMAFYMISFYGAQSLSQFILCLGETQSFILYAIAGLFSFFSLIPIAWMAVDTPCLSTPSSLATVTLMKASLPGFSGALVSGLIMGVIYGLLPTYLSSLPGGTSSVAVYMFAVIFGGMLLQYPLGQWSDRRDRRHVLMWITLMTILTLLCLIPLENQSVWLFGLMMLFGGLTFALYPISVSDVCDVLDQRDMVAATQTLLLAYSAGAMLGPVIAPFFMQKWGSRGLFVYFIVVCVATLPAYVQKRKLVAESEMI